MYSEPDRIRLSRWLFIARTTGCCGPRCVRDKWVLRPRTSGERDRSEVAAEIDRHLRLVRRLLRCIDIGAGARAVPTAARASRRLPTLTCDRGLAQLFSNAHRPTKAGICCTLDDGNGGSPPGNGEGVHSMTTMWKAMRKEPSSGNHRTRIEGKLRTLWPQG